MQVVRLTARDRQLLCARFARHGNSHRSMIGELEEAGAHENRARLAALRRIEKRFDLDLAEICHRIARRNLGQAHPMERVVLDFIAEERHHEDETQLWVLPDRVRQIRDLMEDKRSGEPGS
jgi:hypothetical protein